MTQSRNWTSIERLPGEPVIMERIIKAQYVHREFPVLVARVKQAKRMRERWGRAA